MKFCPYFQHFSSDWIKSGTEDVHKNLSVCESCEKEHSEGILRVINEFLSIFSSFRV